MTTAVEVAEKGHQLAAWVNFNGTFADTSGQSGTYACSGSTITITDTAHGLSVGNSIHATFTRSAGDTTTITDDFFVILTVPSADTFTIQTVVATTDQTGSVVYDSDAATATAGSGPIRAAYNVASITDNGTGDYTVNFTTAMPDENYATTFGCDFYQPSNYSTAVNTIYNGLYSTTSFQIQVTYAFTTAKQNSPRINVAVFR
ncbi:MAG: hypothetical protein CBC12_10695 [Candidatus Puniceispirillum sp. TMED52]|nr:MAG: hypothetical protein CBC12_10695 [Candidatus Puniceispirillum sp. TMED52]|tara:strand:- start:1443 stop:2051 length:609 start_codon:yes stop_codon:yes gene_type:complete